MWCHVSRTHCVHTRLLSVTWVWDLGSSVLTITHGSLGSVMYPALIAKTGQPLQDSSHTIGTNVSTTNMEIGVITPSQAPYSFCPASSRHSVDVAPIPARKSAGAASRFRRVARCLTKEW